MPWTRLDPAGVIRHLRAEWNLAAPGDEALAERALAHLREELLSGRCIAVQECAVEALSSRIERSKLSIGSSGVSRGCLTYRRGKPHKGT